MTHIDLGATGAKVQSWAKHNARELLAKIFRENQDADEEKIYHLFLDECAPYFHEIVRYWVTNNLRALKPKQKLADSAEAVAAAKETIKLRMLDCFLPNGKALRDCTGKECAELSSKVGAWLGKIAKAVGPTKRVGDVLSEEQASALWE